MAETAARRQRSEETGLTRSERGRQSEPIERSLQGSFYPSIFSVGPGEFFTMSPITLMRRLTEDLDRAFSGLGRVSRRGASEEEFTWAPSVEVTQSGNNLVIRADLPGLSENDVTVEATDEGLILQGERKREETKEEGGVYRSERVYGRFYRFIPLPENAKVDQAQANFRNGVLEVTVPVPELERKRRQIPVSTSAQSGQAPQAGQSSQSRSATSSR